MSKELTEEVKQEEKEIVNVSNEVKKEENIEQQENSNNEKNTEIKGEKQEIRQEETQEITSHKGKKIIYSIATILVVLFLIISAFILFAVINSKSNKIIKGVLINNIDVSNLTKNQAFEKINNNIEKDEFKNIKLKYEDYELELVPEQIELEYNIAEAVNEAYKIGRDSNLLFNNINILKTMIIKDNIEMPVTINEEKYNEVVNNIQSNITGAVEESSYIIEGENLIITRGKRGLKVNSDELKNQIINTQHKISKTEMEEIHIPVIESDPKEIDIEKIYNEIYTEAKDAYYVEEPFEVFPHVLGVDFNISIEEAKHIISEKQDQYTIPLKITTPTVTTDQLGTKAFPNLLGRYTTYYSSSSSNRKYNIARAAGSINGKTVMPGEVFSYNKAIGNPSQANGYRLATGFAGGKHVDSYGGGVCQVSSTLYNAVLYANLDIISRSNHSLPVGYVPPSRDATVYYGAVDFKFKNTRNYPIKIVTYASGSALTIEIYGRKEENEYEVVIESWAISSIAPTIKYIENPNLPQGTENVISKGANGYKSVAYKTLKQNGVVISKTLLSSDIYGAEVREIEIGTQSSYQVPVVIENEQESVPIQMQETVPTVSIEESGQENSGESNTGENNNENEDSPETVIEI